MRQVPGTTSQRQRLAVEVRTGQASEAGPCSVSSAQPMTRARLASTTPHLPQLCPCWTALGQDWAWGAHEVVCSSAPLRQARR